MKNLKPTKLSLTISFGLSTVVMFLGQVHLASSQMSKDISLPPNIRQLLDDFELTPVDCSSGVVTIQIETETVCVQPTATLRPGNYIYDPIRDRIRPSGNQSGANSNISQYQFSFTNVFEYSNCLEDILQLYENPSRFRQQGRRSNCLTDTFQSNIERGLSREQALELVAAANAYATSSLSPNLYPPAGIRRRITQTLGFTYTLDANR